MTFMRSLVSVPATATTPAQLFINTSALPTPPSARSAAAPAPSYLLHQLFHHWRIKCMTKYIVVLIDVDRKLSSKTRISCAKSCLLPIVFASIAP
jgi:hypothetical protein